MKRAFDFSASLLGLIVLLPLFIVVSVVVACDSKGGVFYKQLRVGKDGKDFMLYKFRSMYVDSDKKGLLTVGGSDSRITGFGRIIRKYKIDELPQLINVVKGDMSLVGPRPEVRKYVDMYSPEHLRILSVRPGITDPASIKYYNENEILAQQDNHEQYYVDVILPDKQKIYMEYIDNHTLESDIKLIFKTILRSHGI